MSTKRNNTSQGGFTLVELAVVLLIIGLIVGGILRGQDLITSAQLNSVQTDANQIRTATNTFQDKFIALPGDFGNADSAINSSLTLNDGNGNGRIDGNRVSSTGDGNEAVNAWVHLAESDILGSVDANNLNGGSNDLSASNGFAGSVGGFWTFGQGLPNGNFANAAGQSNIWLVLGDTGTDASSDNNDGEIVSAEEAAQLDRKIDDGRPESGTMRASDSCSDDSTPAEYSIDGSSNCALGLQL